MSAPEASAFAAEFAAQQDALTHACRELMATTQRPVDRAAIEESHRIAYAALSNLAKVAGRSCPTLTLVR